MNSSSSDSSLPVGIIGAGPIGIELHAALARLGAGVVHFEAGAIGETISGYPHRVQFFSSPERIQIAGRPLQTNAQRKASREEYLDYLRQVVIGDRLRIRTHERVIAVERSAGGFRIETSRRGQSHMTEARAVVLAIGDMHERRRLDLPGEDLPHVAHRFVDPHEYCGERLLVVGGRNSAVEAALRSYRSGATVAGSYRGEAFPDDVKPWIRSDIENQIRSGRIAFHGGTVPVRIEPDHVVLRPVDDDREIMVPADAVLVLVGFEQDKSLFQLLGCRLKGENESPVHDPETLETSTPGVYVAGTAVAGTQRAFHLFIENCHPHVDAICRALTGEPAPFDTSDASQIAREMPES